MGTSIASFCEFEPYWSNDGKKRFIIQWTAANFNAPAQSFVIPQRFLDLAKEKNIIFTNLRLRYNGQIGTVINRITLAYFISAPSTIENAYIGTVTATVLDGQLISFDHLNIPFFWNEGWIATDPMVSTVQTGYAATDDMNIDLVGYIQHRGPEPFATQPMIPEIPKVTVEGVKFWRR